MKTLSLRRMAASAAVVALGSGALVLGGGTAAQAATGSLSITPATGSSAVSPFVKTSAACSAGATEFYILMKGGAAGFEMPTDGQLIQPPTNNSTALANLSGAGHQTQFAFDDVRADASLPAYNATTGAGGLKGTYTLEVTCTDGLFPLDTFTGQVAFTGAAGSPNTYAFVAPTVATTTTLAVAPASPVTEGDSVTLTATVAPASGPAISVGTVQFKNGAANVGAPVSVAAGSAQLVTTALPQGALSLTAEYSGAATPTATYPASASSPQAYQVNPAPAANTVTALSVTPGTAEAFSSVVLEATVSRESGSGSTPAGTVRFFDGPTALGGAPITVDAAGQAVLNWNTFAEGAHPVTAVFTPAAAAAFNGSTSASVVHTATAPSCVTCNTVGSVTAAIPAGTLTITTPYTAVNPFDLGTLGLDSTGSRFSAQKAFPNTGDRLTVTDTRAGQLGWVASASVTDFSSAGGGAINGQNLSLIGLAPVYLAGNALQAGSVVTTDVPSATVNGYAPADAGVDGLKGVNTFAEAAAGNSVGTVDVAGQLKLIAPTSTPAGQYAATLTFTVG